MGKLAPAAQSVSRLIDSFLATKVAPNTKRTYRAVLSHFFAGGFPIAELREIEYDNVARYRDNLLAGGNSKRTVNKKLCCLRSFFDYLVATDVIEKNPANKKVVPGFRVSSETRGQALDDAEIDALEESCKQGYKPCTHPACARRTPQGQGLCPCTIAGRRDLAICLLGIYEGLRRSEIVRVRLRDIRREHGVWILIIPESKSGEFMKRKLDARAKAAVDDYVDALKKSGMKIGRDDYLFASLSKNSNFKKSRPMSEDSIYKIILRRAQLAGIEKKISPHSLRHTCVTSALSNGAKLVAVQRHAPHFRGKCGARRPQRPEDDDAVLSRT